MLRTYKKETTNAIVNVLYVLLIRRILSCLIQRIVIHSYYTIFMYTHIVYRLLIQCNLYIADSQGIIKSYPLSEDFNIILLKFTFVLIYLMTIFCEKKKQIVNLNTYFKKF